MALPDLQSARYAARNGVARWFEIPAGRFLASLGISPNMATVAGLLLAGGAAYFASNGQFLVAGLVALVAAVFDLLDGAIARQTGAVGDRGALLDSVADRVSEGALLLGLLLYYSSGASFDRTAIVLVFVAFAGSMMVSYVRARAEGLGYRGTAGFLTRPERVVILTGTLIAGFPIYGLWILAVGTPISALHRFWAEWRAATDRGQNEA